MCGSGDGKELEKCREFSFFLHMIKCVFILTRAISMQSQP